MLSTSFLSKIVLLSIVYSTSTLHFNPAHEAAVVVQSNLQA